MATITKRGTKYQVRIVAKGLKPIYKTFTKASVAKKWARDKEIEIEQRRYRDPRGAEDAGLPELIKKFRDEVTPTRATSSQSSDKSRLNMLMDKFEYSTLAALTAQDVLDFVGDRLDDVGGDSVRKELQLFMSVIDVAGMVWGYYVPYNPVSEARRILTKTGGLPTGRSRSRRITKKEYTKITTAKHKQPTVINELITFAVETAMRRSELANMTWEDVALRESTVHIPRTKTGISRTVPLSKRAKAVLKGLDGKQGAVWGMQPRSITQGLERICSDAQITDLRFHDLRHEATSRFFELGLPIQEVAAITGHKDWRSLKRYTHPDAKKLAKKLG